MVFENLMKMHEFELQFVKQCGHIDMCPCDTPISTDDLVYEYLVDTGHNDIAKELSKLRDCRSINNGLSLQKIYDEFTQKNKALKRNLSERTLPEIKTSLSDKKFCFKSHVEEREYDELISVSEAFEFEIKNFVPKENSILDFTVKNLLKVDLKVPFVCLKLSCNSLKSKAVQLKYPKIRIGRFTKVEGGEKETILKSWDSLVKDFDISDPKQLQDELKCLRNVHGFSRDWKVTVIGAYLTQQLPHLRHPVNVFIYAIENVICQKYQSGRFTLDEDGIILSEINLHGDTSDTFKKLSLILRRPKNDVKRHYKIILNNCQDETGRWKLKDCQILIDCLFPNSALKAIDNILSIGLPEIRKCGAAKYIKRADTKVCNYWNTSLRPMLLSFHFGVLHKPWKPTFLDYLIRKKIMAVQDINFDEVSQLCPGVLNGVADRFIQNIKFQSGKDKDLPLYIIAQNLIHKYKDKPDCGPKECKFREAIVDYYDKDETINKRK